MNRIYVRCPQCQGKECSDLSCKFSGTKHEKAAQAVPREARDGIYGDGPAAAIDIGYECAWPHA